MIKRILAVLLLVACCLLASPMAAQAKDILGPSAQCSAATGTNKSAICTDDATSQGNPNDNPVIDKLEDIANIVAIIAGAAAVLLLLVGSIQYITSGGDSNKVSSAKNTVIYALVGLVVVALSATIIEFVLNKL